MRTAIALAVIAAVAGCSRTVNTTKGISAICPVHHVRMEKREVAVMLGYPGPQREILANAMLAGSIRAFSREEAALFPYSKDYYFGGDDIIDENPPKRAILYVCPECVKAFAEWKLKKGANQPPASPPVRPDGEPR